MNRVPGSASVTVRFSPTSSSTSSGGRAVLVCAPKAARPSSMTKGANILRVPGRLGSALSVGYRLFISRTRPDPWLIVPHQRHVHEVLRDKPDLQLVAPQYITH